MKNIVTIAREAALDILDALDTAITRAVAYGWLAERFILEDAYSMLLDVLFPTMPDGRPGRIP